MFNINDQRYIKFCKNHSTGFHGTYILVEYIILWIYNIFPHLILAIYFLNYMLYLLLFISEIKSRIIPIKAKRQEGSKANKKSRRLSYEIMCRKEIATYEWSGPLKSEIT